MCPRLPGRPLGLSGRDTIGLELENSTLAARPSSSPVQRQCLQVVRYHVTPLHVGLERVFVTLALTNARVCSVLEFTVKDDLWQLVVIHTYHVTSSAKL